MEPITHSEVIQEGRRPRNVIIADVVGSLLLLLITFALFNGAWSAFREFVHLAGVSGWFGESAAAAAESGERHRYLQTAFVLALVCFVLFFLGAFLPTLHLGIARLLGGLVELTRPKFPNDMPPGLGVLGEKNDAAPVKPGEIDGGNVAEILKKGNLGHYKEINPFMNSMFGRRAVYLAPIERGVATRLGEELHGRMMGFIGIGIAALGFLWLLNWLSSPSSGGILPEGSDTELITVLRESATMKAALIPFVWVLALFVSFAGAAYLALQWLMPTTVPAMKPLYAGDDVRGFGHPQQLHVRLPRIGESKQLGDRRNACWSPPLLETASNAVKDAGTFSSQVVLERHPETIIDSSSKRTAWLMLILGWATAIAGTWLILGYLLPGPLKRATEPDAAPPLLWLPVYILGASVAASSLLKFSRKWLGAANELFRTIRYRSVVALAEFNGQVTVSEVRVGKAAHDSIESSRRVVSSDFTARYHTAEVISQSPGDGGARRILELRDSPLAHEWLDHIAEQVRSMGCEPVRISNIDTNAEAAALVQANVRIAHARKSVAPPPLQGSPQALAMHDTPLLGDGAEHAPAAAEDNAPRPGYRECPSCAEWIREKARVCRFCQSELQTPESA